MAKSDLLKALAVLSELGISLSPEQQESLDALKSDAMKNSAIEYMDGKLNDDVDVTEWVTDSFDFAAKVWESVKGENVGRGRGEVFEQVYRFDTPNGTLKVSLTNEPQAE